MISDVSAYSEPYKTDNNSLTTQEELDVSVLNEKLLKDINSLFESQRKLYKVLQENEKEYTVSTRKHLSFSDYTKTIDNCIAIAEILMNKFPMFILYSDDWQYHLFYQNQGENHEHIF